MGVVVQAGQRFASIADLQVGDGNQQAAVGTTVALLERRGSELCLLFTKEFTQLLKMNLELWLEYSSYIYHKNIRMM